MSEMEMSIAGGLGYAAGILIAANILWLIDDCPDMNAQWIFAFSVLWPFTICFSLIDLLIRLSIWPAKKFREHRRF